jgi:hypothetical protein
MNQYEMVVLIVFIVMVASVLKSRVQGGRRRGSPEIEPAEQAENLRLRDEVKQLKERIHVLERIATDKESSLAREIDDLRNR